MKKTVCIVLAMSLAATMGLAACDSHEHKSSAARYSTTPTEHWKLCDECREVIEEGPHTDADNNGKCDICGYSMDTSHTHTPTQGYESDADGHWKGCTECGTELEWGPHADADGDGKCDLCEYTMETPHTHTPTQGYESDANGHWKNCSGCEERLEEDPHSDTDGDGKCNVCGYTMSTDDDPDYEFSDEITAQNTAFYKDYSDEEKALYYTLWEETTSVSIKVDISDYELAKINEAYLSGDPVKQDTYRKCDLTITVNGEDYRFEEVGVRMRGNTSRREFCDGEGQIYAFIHLRFAFDETFDGSDYAPGSWASELYHDWSNNAEGRAARDDRTFATMKKCYYKWNKNYDQTFIREVYANRMFRAYGILAPHITLTQLSLKQKSGMESLGVGGLYETIDKQFIKRNFDKANKGGDLYKCTYTGMGPADLADPRNYGIGDEHTYALKTNDDPADPDYNNHKYLLAFLEALSTPNTEEFTAKIENLMDMDYFARFEAVNYLLGNPDCIRNNSNNYYLYFTPAGKTYLIPYDYDRCLGVTFEYDPDGTGMTAPGPYDGPVNNTYNRLYEKTIWRGGVEKYRLLYKSKLETVLGGEWFTAKHFQTIYEAYKATYSALAQPSQTIREQCRGSVDSNSLVFSERGRNMTVEEYMTAKRQTAERGI